LAAKTREEDVMQRGFYLALLFGLSLHIVASEVRRPMPAQAARGRELFLQSPKGTACGTCHALAGIGTAVGPDLTKLAAPVGPRGIASAIRMTVTAYVLEVQSEGSTFPAIQKLKLGDKVELWDLSHTLPALRKLDEKQIIGMKANTTWKHPPASAGYTSKELADLIGFLKWAATGTQTEVTAAEVE
jgi:mono/diheme cytochrome c family protein